MEMINNKNSVFDQQGTHTHRLGNKVTKMDLMDPTNQDGADHLEEEEAKEAEEDDEEDVVEDEENGYQCRHRAVEEETLLPPQIQI
ncbi:hypothetical protein ACLOJK_039742 [Asimina triloba]